MTTSEKLDIVYSFNTYSTKSNPLSRKQDFLSGDDRPLLKFLSESENLDVNDETLFSISQSLNFSKFSDPDFENLGFYSEGFDSSRNIYKIFQKEDVYGEITRNGVETLAIKLQQNIKENSSELEFIDLGSGKGKLVLHLSLITNFKWYTGVELCQNKHRESLIISESSRITDKITLLNDDMFNLELSKFDVVFFNDVCYRESLRINLFRLLKPGCIVVTSKKITYSSEFLKLDYIDRIGLECSWVDSKYFYIYRK